MTLNKILREKLFEYTQYFGIEAGFDLLLMELEAEAWTVKAAFLEIYSSNSFEITK